MPSDSATAKAIAEIVAKPLFGFIADRTGMKRTMLIGLAVFSVASLGFFAVNPRLLLIRLLQGLGAAALSIVSAAMVAAYFPTSRGQASGVNNAIKGAGYVISPVIGGPITWFPGMLRRRSDTTIGREERGHNRADRARREG